MTTFPSHRGTTVQLLLWVSCGLSFLNHEEPNAEACELARSGMMEQHLHAKVPQEDSFGPWRSLTLIGPPGNPNETMVWRQWDVLCLQTHFLWVPLKTWRSGLLVTFGTTVGRRLLQPDGQRSDRHLSYCPCVQISFDNLFWNNVVNAVNCWWL